MCRLNDRNDAWKDIEREEESKRGEKKAIPSDRKCNKCRKAKKEGERNEEIEVNIVIGMEHVLVMS